MNTLILGQTAKSTSVNLDFGLFVQIHYCTITFIIRKFSKDELIFFNVLTGQNQGLTEKKFLWPVTVSGHCLKIILSLVSTGSVHGSPDLPNC